MTKRNSIIQRLGDPPELRRLLTLAVILVLMLSFVTACADDGEEGAVDEPDAAAAIDADEEIGDDEVLDEEVAEDEVLDEDEAGVEEPLEETDEVEEDLGEVEVDVGEVEVDVEGEEEPVEGEEALEAEEEVDDDLTEDEEPLGEEATLGEEDEAVEEEAAVEEADLAEGDDDALLGEEDEAADEEELLGAEDEAADEEDLLAAEDEEDLLGAEDEADEDSLFEAEDEAAADEEDLLGAEDDDFGEELLGPVGAAEEVTVDDIFAEPDTFVGRQVAVTAELGRGVSQEAFTIEEDDIFTESELLVLDVNQRILDLDVNSDDTVVVRGEVREFVQAEVEEEFGLDLDDAAFESFENQTYIVAEAVELAEAGE